MMEKILFGYQNNGTDEELEKMRSKAKRLFARAGDIAVEVKAAELIGCKRKNEVENWLQNVENVKVKKQCIEDQVQGGASSSRTVPNVQVAKITKEIDELLQHSLPKELAFPDGAFSNVPFVTGSLKGHLFEENLKLILSLLDDDDVATIGIHGAGGIGKTTLVTHVQKRLCEKFNNDRCPGNVYFVTVSHGLTISGLQFKIAKQLNLKIEGEDERKAAAMIYGTFMRRKYSVLILDDLWESFRPSDVGLPVGKGGFKLLLTTRSSRVCNEINNEKPRIIQVERLSEDESWDLFRENLGDSAILSQEIDIDIARKVAKKCGGLPLALEHIAISMRAADTVEEWRTVLADMSSMVLPVVEDKVLPLLRYSYDRLKDEQLKDCFLYCSFFPEDHEIDRTELVDIWIREGLLDGIENRERQRDKGFTIFKELIDLSLLKAVGKYYPSAKMHDLVREMAVKVGKEKGFLIRAGEKMRDIPDEQEWNEDLCKVSLMVNDIGSISPDVAPRCPNLSTLLLNDNRSLTSISSLFFSLMDGLCVLDLSATEIEKLPDSVSNLKNLTALLLTGCIRLNYVPSLSMLGKLREMDISWCSKLRDLPHGMEGLVNLKFLDCIGCPAPVSGILSGLSHLEELRLCEAKGQDLMKLMHLERLTCRIRNVSEFNEYVMSQCFASLHGYCLTVGHSDGYKDFNDVDRSVKFVECRFEEDSPIFPGNVEELILERCSGGEYLERDLPHGMGGLVNLKFLNCGGCPAPVSGILSGLSHLETHCEAKGQDLMKLMHLERLTCRIRNVSEFNEYVMSQSFASLHAYCLTVGHSYGEYDFFDVDRFVEFVECRFEEDSPILPGNVEGLGLARCSGVEYLVSSASPDSTLIPLQTLGHLVQLDLIGLENFKGLVKPGVALPSGSLSNLVSLGIEECHGIKKLFTSSMVRGNLQNLRQLRISNCRHLEEVIGGSDSDNDDDDYFEDDDYDKIRTDGVEIKIKDERLSICFPSTAFALFLGQLPNFKRVHRKAK